MFVSLERMKLTLKSVQGAIKKGGKVPFAIQHYSSKGQTAVQELYHTSLGKFFLKRVSDRNHSDCQINVQSGTLAEREFWAYRIAHKIGLEVPQLFLFDKSTTVQIWLDIPDMSIWAAPPTLDNIILKMCIG